MRLGATGKIGAQKQYKEIPHERRCEVRLVRERTTRNRSEQLVCEVGLVRRGNATRHRRQACVRWEWHALCGDDGAVVMIDEDDEGDEDDDDDDGLCWLCGRCL